MPAIRVVMPNGTTRSFREGTPQSAIRRAQQDMLADMKASGEYEGIDFSPLNGAQINARVMVTQESAANKNTGALQKVLPKPNPLRLGIPTPNPLRMAEQAGPNQVIWSEPSQPASPGQDRDDNYGAGAIQYAYANGKGADYRVDPSTMKLENSIDLSEQIQESIDNNGYMRSVLEQSRKSGRPVSFNSKDWHPDTGLTRFQGDTGTEAGKSVGRYGGNVTGYLFARPDGTYTVFSTVKLEKNNPYSWERDGENPWQDFQIYMGGRRTFNNDGKPQPYSQGTPMMLKFTRDATVYSNGTYKR